MLNIVNLVFLTFLADVSQFEVFFSFPTDGAFLNGRRLYGAESIDLMIFCYCSSSSDDSLSDSLNGA